MSRINVSEPNGTSNTTEKITTNEHKLNQMERGFLTALVKLLLHGETEQACRVATLFSRLENNPLDPLYEGIWHIQTIVKYVCAESPTKERVRSALEQLVAQHPSSNSDVAADDPVPKPEVDTGTSIENSRTNSRHPKKRPISRSETEPSKVTKKPRHRKRATSSSNPLTTIDPQLLPPNHVMHPFLNNPGLELTTEANTDYRLYDDLLVDSPYAG
ncbi:4023_t:CDS:2 [Paraglomus brasilianum]|uniref:4023_t:CDS:1 n=1 Tax=Paraglomus brasilianum TaxID=144538 RepID=A0A9N9C8R4_9GLOM|nr:4023_t:CDS:2 [Paraglomus brasilianum]